MSKGKWRAAHIAKGENGWDWCNEPPTEHDTREEALEAINRRISAMDRGTGRMEAYYKSRGALEESGASRFVVVAPEEDLIPKKKGWFW